MGLPLEGIVVVEANATDAPLALRLAGSLTGRIAADLGARVIKLEPPEGDPVRRIPPFLDDSSTLFAFLNAGKRSIAVRAGEEARILSPLLARSAAFISDDRLHEKLGGGLSARIAVVFSMFGAAVPTSVPASEFTVMALGGLLDAVGESGREPLRLGGHQLAYSTGLAGYTGLAAALCRPSGNGAREIVRANLLDTAVWLNWKNVATAGWSGNSPSRAGDTAEWQVVRCADGWVAIVYQDTQWPQYRELIGDPALHEERFKTRAQRRPHSRELAGIATRSLMNRTRAEIRDLALKLRVPLGPVWSPKELEQDPQNMAREFLQTVQLGGRKIAMPRLPVLWSQQAFAPGAVPALGELGESEALR